MNTLISQLKNIVGADRFQDAESLLAQATSYWDSSPTKALCKVSPSTTEQVSQILQLCHEHHQPVVTQGGLTGCVTGAKSHQQEVILSLEKLNQIIHIDEIGGTVTVESGVILEVLQQSVLDKQMMFPVDLGARGSCTIGGNIATNAGGINVLRYGMIRNLVLGLEVVLADGTVLDLMNQMLKNNTAYDLKQLFIGSEGTLGVVTKAVLKLTPNQNDSNTAMVALSGFNQVQQLLSRAQSELHGTLSAFEVMWGEYYRAVTVDGHHTPILEPDHNFYVQMEITHRNNQQAQNSFTELLEQAFEAEIIEDAAIPKSEQDRRRMWDIRENFESIVAQPTVFMYDISLPVKTMNDYINGLRQSLQDHSADTQLLSFGHIADGNLHLFIIPGSDKLTHAVSDDLVYTPLKAIGGAISAEHGIGTEKMDALVKYSDPAVLAVMKSLKQTMDPKGILNPGRVLSQ